MDVIKAADMGAGTGIFSRLLGDEGVNVTAIEPNKAMAEAADEHPNVNYVICTNRNERLRQQLF